MMSKYVTIKDNIFNRTSLRIYEGEMLIQYEQVFLNWSIYPKHWNTHTIENNTINGKIIKYYKNENNIDIPYDFGELILANCSNIILENLNINQNLE